ncbi:hypothetical protein DFH09DRAFT_1086123 [Mycena vulgaris]|nr:hypothetical protein DFH09DRAFT_1086123 [Mycena vulgaris]
MYRTLYPFNVQQKHSVARQKAAKFYGCTTSTACGSIMCASVDFRLSYRRSSRGNLKRGEFKFSVRNGNSPTMWSGNDRRELSGAHPPGNSTLQLPWCCALLWHHLVQDGQCTVGEGNWPDMNVQYLNTAVAQRSAIRRTDTKKHSCLNARATWHDRTHLCPPDYAWTVWRIHILGGLA